MKKIVIVLFISLMPMLLSAQPDIPLEEWSEKTILLIGGHPDDDASSHGTLAMLNENGNDIYILILTTGNVGTGDSTMTRMELEKIRRQEQLDAMKELGLGEENYVNLGYTDGMVEFADKKEVVQQLVRHIREIRPDVLVSFDPGWGYQSWHKSDHRAAAYLAADAARAAEWHLIFPGQIHQEGLEAHSIGEYLFFSSPSEAQNVHVDISDYAEMKFRARTKYISQFSPENFNNYTGPDPEDLPGDAGERFVERMRHIVFERNLRDGRPNESFRYYKGNPDGMGSRRD